MFWYESVIAGPTLMYHLSGPCEDTTKEMPFELLNTIQVRDSSRQDAAHTQKRPCQNAIAEHGNGVYWKGVTVEGPDYETTVRAYERIQEVSRDGRFTAIAIYEWWPLQKILSVPADRTVFHRIPRPNCLILIGWPGRTNSEEKVDEARRYAHEIAVLVAGGLNEMKDARIRGYNNYGKNLFRINSVSSGVDVAALNCRPGGHQR